MIFFPFCPPPIKYIYEILPVSHRRIFISVSMLLFFPSPTLKKETFDNNLRTKELLDLIEWYATCNYKTRPVSDQDKENMQTK